MINVSMLWLCLIKDGIEDDHDYDRVIFSGESDDDDDDEGIYKIPRNVVSLKQRTLL